MFSNGIKYVFYSLPVAYTDHCSSGMSSGISVSRTSTAVRANVIGWWSVAGESWCVPNVIFEYNHNWYYLKKWYLQGASLSRIMLTKRLVAMQNDLALPVYAPTPMLQLMRPRAQTFHRVQSARSTMVTSLCMTMIFDLTAF